MERRLSREGAGKGASSRRRIARMAATRIASQSRAKSQKSIGTARTTQRKSAIALRAHSPLVPSVRA